MPKRPTKAERGPKKLPTPDKASRSMIHVFGWAEAECVARIICERARKANTWEVSVYPGAFADDPLAKEGVEFLKGRGFLKYHLDYVAGVDVGNWRPTVKFIKRVCGREAMKYDRREQESIEARQ